MFYASTRFYRPPVDWEGIGLAATVAGISVAMSGWLAFLGWLTWIVFRWIGPEFWIALAG